MVVAEIKGKQYALLEEGAEVEVDHIKLEKGENFLDAKALLYKNKEGKVLIGRPYLQNVKLTLGCVNQKKDKKIEAVRYRPKSGIRKKRGFRAMRTVLRFDKIEVK